MPTEDDRARVEAWFSKYGTMPPGLAKSLEQVGDVPVDIYPQFAFHED